MRIFPILLSMLLLLSARSTLALELNPDHPQTYRVRPGDTLWSIASRFLKDPWRWSEIWDANPALGDPDLIYPGDVLSLYYKNGQPRIGRAAGRMRTVKLSPQVRATRLQAPIPTIPIGSIYPFLTRPYVLEREEIKAAPYVVSFPDQSVLAGVGDRVYVRKILNNKEQHYHIVRPGEAYRDPDTDRLLGYQARYVADASLQNPGDPASLRINSMTLETAIGDRVIPAAATEPLQTFYPHPAPPGRRGRIIASLNSLSQIGRYDVVVINLGKRQGVEVGQVFNVYNGGNVVKDRAATEAGNWDWKNMPFWSQEFWYDDHRTQGWLFDEPNENEPFPPHMWAKPQEENYMLPYEQAGVLMVFRAFDELSFGLILRANRVINLLDSVQSPET